MSIPDHSWAFVVASCTADELSDALDIAGISSDGLSEERGAATAWFSGSRPPRMPVEGTWTRVAKIDWSEAWKEGLDPVAVGDFTVATPWNAPDGPQLEGPPYVLVIEPGLAFGTGHHETTTFCLQALQAADVSGSRVIDIGTGTGVLALTAKVLGAGEVVAVDTDPDAIDVARANIQQHGISDIQLLVGSWDVVDGVGDIVVANIITDVLLGLADGLASILAPDGLLICCGIDVSRTEEALAVFQRAGIQMAATEGREWALLTGQHV